MILEAMSGKAIRMLNPIIKNQLTECEVVEVKIVCNIYIFNDVY
jgi:hypothetical protein